MSRAGVERPEELEGVLSLHSPPACLQHGVDHAYLRLLLRSRHTQGRLRLRLRLHLLQHGVDHARRLDYGYVYGYAIPRLRLRTCSTTTQ